MNLEVGDVLLLDRNADTPVTVHVPGCVSATAVAGKANRRRAVRMLGPVRPLQPPASDDAPPAL
jgi:flagellar motor switch protein FliM